MEGMSDAAVWHLPSEVLVLIFSFLPAEDIGRAASVCSQWSQVAEDWRVWRGKNFLSEGGRGLSDALSIARVLPVLKRVSIHRNKVYNIYLDGNFADFMVPDLRDEVVTSAISALVTEKLSVDFILLEETCSNCLVVQLHELKQLKVRASRSLLPRETVAAKMWALGSTLSRESMPSLQSADIHVSNYSVGAKEDVDSDIMGALSSCSALERVVIRTCCSLSWHTVTEFSILRFLQLRDCIIEDISFLDLCPNLHSLSLDNCSPLGMRELSRVSELRNLILRHLSVNTELLDTLCRASPKLEEILIDECWHVTHTLFLGHCPQLSSVEIDGCGRMFPSLAGLPSGLQILKLNSPLVTSDSLAEILLGLPRLEILDVVSCNVESLRFLRHCPGLTELSLGLEFHHTFEHFNELGGLRSLKKLYLHYGEGDVGPLAGVLRNMPQLEELDVVFLASVSNLSFLRYCHRLRCLRLGFYAPFDMVRLYFQEISNLKELRKLVLNYDYLGVEDLAAFLPSVPHLEELDVRFVDTECKFPFLRHCGRLTSLQICCGNVRVSHLKQLRQLVSLRRLTVIGLLEDRQSLAEEVARLPNLEYLGLQMDGPNLLESFEWHKMRLSLGAKS